MTDLIGQHLGRYQILELIGEGGMASVYRVLDIRLNSYVALKLLKQENFPPAALPTLQARFEREVREMARLSHPHIMPILDYGEMEGVPFLVMKLMEGGSLKKRMEDRAKPVPWKEAVELARLIAGAMAYAHKLGVIHRDIKPANILLNENGDPVLSDFGIAKVMDQAETTDLTATNVIVGTPEYMAPELGLGQPADTRTDVYSLGIVLYELITGRKPFKADTPMGVLLKHATEPLPKPKSLVPDLPDKVEAILLKALAKKPEQRYQSMGEFGESLQKIESGKERAATFRKGWAGIFAAATLLVAAALWGSGTWPPVTPTPTQTAVPIAAVSNVTSRPSETLTVTRTAMPTATFTETSFFTPIPSHQIQTVSPTIHNEVTAQVATSFAYIRHGPGSSFRAIISVVAGDVLRVVGKSEDGSWLVVELDDGREGWIGTGQVHDVMGLASVPVVLPPTPMLKPTHTVEIIIIYPHADINKDCIVDEKDYEILMSHWTGSFDQYGPNYHSRADLSTDGINPGSDGYINSADYNYLINNWGATCEFHTR